MLRYIKNCRLIDNPEQRVHVGVKNGRIHDISPRMHTSADILLDAGGHIVAPGLIDTHVHGAGGGDLSNASEASFHTAATTLCRLGTTSFYATTFYRPGHENPHLLNLATAGKTPNEAECPGIHLEGPFINPVKKGGIPPEYLTEPDIAVLRDIQEHTSGKLAILTCAPELPGMDLLLSACKEDGIVASFGHSDANTEETRRGFKLGMSFVTHLGNAMRPFHHREPGPLPAILASGAHVQLISDGVHLHADAVRFFYDMFGAERCVSITDGIECTGLPDGEYHFREKAYVSEKGAVSYADGSGLIGTSLSLFEIVMRFKRFTGCSLYDAIRTATENPARCLGIADRKGFIKPGYDADLIVIDDRYKLHTVIKNGSLV